MTTINKIQLIPDNTGVIQPPQWLIDHVKVSGLGVPFSTTGFFTDQTSLSAVPLNLNNQTSNVLLQASSINLIALI